jgi:hypothetical protein
MQSTTHTEQNPIETFELETIDARAYFANDDDIVIEEGDRVIIELNHELQSATYIIVPENSCKENFVPEEDDYDGVVLFLIEHDYKSDALIAARKSQLGMYTQTFGDQEANDILELDSYSDECLNGNFGYSQAGIENLRSNATYIRQQRAN